MVTEFQGQVIRALNDVDQRNQDLLDQVIDAANDVAGSGAAGGDSCVTFGDETSSGKADGPALDLARARDTVVETEKGDSITTGSTAWSKGIAARIRDSDDDGEE